MDCAPVARHQNWLGGSEWGEFCPVPFYFEGRQAYSGSDELQRLASAAYSIGGNAVIQRGKVALVVDSQA